MRRTETLVIPGVRSDTFGERDNGKTFILTEMDAYSGQDWALRALLALAASGVQLPTGAETAGMAALAGFGVTALLQAPYAALKPLLDEMLAQARYQHYDTKGKVAGPPQAIVQGVNCCIEEVRTFLTIQKALLFLHTGFSPAVATPT